MGGACYRCCRSEGAERWDGRVIGVVGLKGRSDGRGHYIGVVGLNGRSDGRGVLSCCRSKGEDLWGGGVLSCCRSECGWAMGVACYHLVGTLLEKRVFYTTEKEFSKCPCIRTLFEH